MPITRSKINMSMPELAKSPDILEALVDELTSRGVVGEARAAKLIYLAATSRLFKGMREQVSLITKAQSSAGKSYVAQNVFAFFKNAVDVIWLTSVSPKGLAYAQHSLGSLAGKTLFVGEASGLGGGDGASMLRQLMSEGCINHQTVIDGKGQLLRVEGPLNVVVTTTAFNLDPELETRTLTVPLDESAEQTRAIITSRAKRAAGTITEASDLNAWHDLQRWLANHGERRVVVPFAPRLAKLIPPVAVRLRRDINTILNLISAHAFLHQATRSKDGQGRVVATLADYAAVRELVADLVSEGAEVTVKPAIREIVEAVRAAKGQVIHQCDLAKKLGKHKSTISRQVGEAIAAGYLRREADVLQPGDPLPDAGGGVLPELHELQGVA